MFREWWIDLRGVFFLNGLEDHLFIKLRATMFGGGSRRGQERRIQGLYHLFSEYCGAFAASYGYLSLSSNTGKR